MENKLKLKRIINKNGVRTCMIVNASNGLPLTYENLYLAVLSRTKNYSYSTIESIAGTLMSFVTYLNHKEIRLTNDYKKGQVIDSRFAYNLMIHFSGKKRKRSVANVKEDRNVSENCLHFKLTVIEKYLTWFYLDILEYNHRDIKFISKNFKTIKPNVSINKSYSECEEKSLDKKQIEILNELIKRENNKNPFKACVRFRNELIINILSETGMRGGELLNLKIEDFKYRKRELHIIRRPDDKEDIRSRQPLVKTFERKIPLTRALSEKIRNYIDNERSNQKLSKKHNYLIVTHSSNFSMGRPLTISGYQKIFNTIRRSETSLENFVAHSLRHTWNINYSERVYQIASPNHYEMYEKVRNYLMGWSRTSKSAATYTQRYIINESYKIMQLMNSTSFLEKEPKQNAQKDTNNRKSVFGF